MWLRFLMEKERLVFEADPDLAARINEWRHTQRIGSRAEAIRKLVIGALQAGIVLDAFHEPVMPTQKQTGGRNRG